MLRVSGDGLKAVAKAAELMLADMAAKACSAAQGQKRKTIKLSDIEQTGDRARPQYALARQRAARPMQSRGSQMHLLPRGTTLHSATNVVALVRALLRAD